MNEDKLNGITVGGKSVLKYIADKESDEKTKEVRKDFHQKESKSGFYNSPRTKIGKNTSKSSGTTLLPRSQINREYWRNNMKSNNAIKVILGILLKGDKVTGKAIMNTLKAERPSIAKKANVPAIMSTMYQSELGALIVKENISATGKPVYNWSLAPGAYELTLDQLYGLYDGRDKIHTIANLKDAYPWVRHWLEEIKWTGPRIRTPRKSVKKVVPITAKKKDFNVEDYRLTKENDPRKTLASGGSTAGKQDGLIKQIEEAISSAIGVKVEIDCNINVRFGLLD